jgi:hypothetical protein
MRRGVAGGLTARLMYAGWDRSSAIRRRVPWTKCAGWVRHSLNGDQFCGGGAPAHGGVLALAQLEAGASVTVWHDLRCGGLIRRERAGGPSDQAVISAQTNPASSRAMAVTTILRLVLRSSRRRNRPHRRSWAAQARAIVSGWTP